MSQCGRLSWVSVLRMAALRFWLAQPKPMMPSTSLKLALLQCVIIPRRVSTLYLPSCRPHARTAMLGIAGPRTSPARASRKGRSRNGALAGSHLSIVLAVVAEQVGLVEERHIDVVQLDQLEGGALCRVEEELLVVVIRAEQLRGCVRRSRVLVAC
jgi:hypothetical protein